MTKGRLGGMREHESMYYGNVAFIIAGTIHLVWATGLLLGSHELNTVGIYPILVVCGGHARRAGVVLVIASMCGFAALRCTPLVKLGLLVLQQFILSLSAASVFIGAYVGYFPDGYKASSGAFIFYDHSSFVVLAVAHAALLFNVGLMAARYGRRGPADSASARHTFASLCLLASRFTDANIDK